MRGIDLSIVFFGGVIQIRIEILALLVLAIAVLPVPTNGAWVLDAEPMVEGRSPFQIQFNDLNGDHLFSDLSELTSFSGVTIFTNYRTAIYAVANIPDITVPCVVPPCSSGSWIFGSEGEGIIVAYATDWSYRLTGPPPTAPPPPTNTPTFTATPMQSPTTSAPTSTPTRIPSATATPTSTPVALASQTPTPTATPTAAVSPTCVRAASFQGVGDLPGGYVYSDAKGVSADGQVVVGASYSTVSGSLPEAFRWTQAGGIVGLGTFPSPYPSSGASAVSADGTIVVGSTRAEPTDFRVCPPSRHPSHRETPREKPNQHCVARPVGQTARATVVCAGSAA
jgi:probable HAF family extracellular repeat protein